MSATSPEISAPVRRPARERIFNAAKDLFYRYGIRAVGVDSIAAEAGATKMTLYRSFDSKDKLVAECLRGHSREFWEWWDEIIAPHAGNPKAQLLTLMKAFTEGKCGEEESHGCPMANAIVELSEKDPGFEVVVEHKAEMRKRLRELCTELKARNPALLADALHLLIEGGYISSRTFQEGKGPADAVPKLARVLIEEHLKS